MPNGMLTEKTIVLNAAFSNKEEAIRFCGELLRAAGYVERGYIDAMVKRDELSTTYVGNGVAVPHGTEASKVFVKRTGLAVVQVPAGIDFGKGRMAKLLIAVAAAGSEHIELLTDIAQICVNDQELGKILAADRPEQIMAAVASVGK